CKPVEKEELLVLLENLRKKLSIKRDIKLCYLDSVSGDTGPSVVGIIKPKILIPSWIADRWTADELEPVLLHELAHIKRNDIIVNWIQIIVQAVYFFHPFVWFANRQIRKHREEVCDDLAIANISAERKRYSVSILNVLEGIIDEKRFVFSGIGFTEKKSSLSKRILRIMKIDRVFRVPAYADRNNRVSDHMRKI
ncbi:M56 family metallopeptidase, partial [candidate division KSB1 bacterium]